MAQNDEGRRDSGGGSVCGVDHVWRGLEISLNAGDGGLGGGHIFVFFFFALLICRLEVFVHRRLGWPSLNFPAPAIWNEVGQSRTESL